jgi:feruloyl esterase
MSKEDCNMKNSSKPFGRSKRAENRAAACMAGAFFLVSALCHAATPAVSCENLAKLALPDTTITMAQPVAAGEFKMPANGMGPGAPQKSIDVSSLPAFCRVAATLKPSSDSNIRIEVWLPMPDWNGKFMGVGGGGWSGNINYERLIDGLRQGYAVANTDSGHDNTKPEEAGGRFLPGHPEKLIDYGYRAVHLMTLRSKDITTTFYGSAPKHSYFLGGSRGGYEAITEANRYPADYDGICAGWPANPFVLFNAEQIWPSWLINQKPERLIPQSKYAMIHAEVLKECDELDGVKDGLLENPQACHFDPKVLLCKGADAPDCLTAPQVELLQKTYQGPVNPRTGEVIFPGPPVGDEIAEMYRFAMPEPQSVALDMFKYVVFQDPNWDWKTMNWDSDIDKALAVTKPVLYTEPNFKAYIDRGGKLMIYSAWINYHNPAQFVDYYKKAVKNVGADKAANSLLLFTIPGVFRPETLFDQANLIDEWVENGKTPYEFTGTYFADGKVLRTRPICAYPKVAQYKGTGSTDEAANFVCAESKFNEK